MEKVCIIIPCYRASKTILPLLKKIGSYATEIIVIDDACPEKSGQLVQDCQSDPRVKVIFHPKNLGVGGAMKTGFRAGLESGKSDYFVKLDSDGQMSPDLIPRLLKPIKSGDCDFAKGCRFFYPEQLRKMPQLRRIGNMGLSFLVKVTSGYWNVSDPTNGFFIIHRPVLDMMNLSKLDDRYFFECSLLNELGLMSAVVKDVPLPSQYDGEISSLNPLQTLFTFPPKLIVGFFRRVYWRYFFYTFHPITLFLLIGIILLSFGTLFGIYKWHLGSIRGEFQTAGTVFLAGLPVILGMQFLLAAALLDILNVPHIPLSRFFEKQADDSEKH